ncbi:MAG: flagellar export chaperone FlgN [Roseburia sp.]
MDDLLDVIEQEEKHYRKLIGLSTDKKNAIIKGDIRTLEDITNEEQDVTSILKNLETKKIRGSYGYGGCTRTGCRDTYRTQNDRSSGKTAERTKEVVRSV